MNIVELICPICGRPNQCGHPNQWGHDRAQSGGPPCCCNEVKVGTGVMARIPPEKLGKACVYRECIEKYA